MQNQNTRQLPKRKNFPFWAIILLVIGGILTIGLIENFFGLAGDNSDDKPEKMSEAIITQALVSPTTARFSGVSEEKKKDGVIFVTGFVDAQNSFSAMIRNDWMCILSNSPNSGLIWLTYKVGNTYGENPAIFPQTNSAAELN